MGKKGKQINGKKGKTKMGKKSKQINGKKGHPNKWEKEASK